MKRYLVHDLADGGWGELRSYEVADYVALHSSSRILRIDAKEWIERAEHGMVLKLESADQRIVVMDDDRLIPCDVLQPA